MNTLDITYDILVEDDRWLDILPDYESIIAMSAERALKATCLFKNGKELEISVSMTNDDAIQTLNRDYRDKDKATNVLSFPQIDWDTPEEELSAPLIMLGDVVVALETIQSEALEQNKPLQDHFTHMIIHSVLHLCGYDHINDKEAEEMESLEIIILNDMGIKNPY